MIPLRSDQEMYEQAQESFRASIPRDVVLLPEEEYRRFKLWLSWKSQGDRRKDYLTRTSLNDLARAIRDHLLQPIRELAALRERVRVLTDQIRETDAVLARLRVENDSLAAGIVGAASVIDASARAQRSVS